MEGVSGPHTSDSASSGAQSSLRASERHANADEEEHVIDDLPEIREEDAEEVIVLDGKDGAPPPDDEDDDSEDDMADSTMADEKDASPEAPQDNRPAADIPEDAVLVLRQHTADALCVAASPTDKKMLASGGQDDVGALWDLEDGMHVGEVDGAGESVSTVAFSTDGVYVAFGSENGAIAVVLMNNAEAPRAPLEGPGDAIHSLCWHPRGPILLAGSADGVAYMWNAAKAKFMMAFAGHQAAVTTASFSADGKLVVTSSLDMSLRVWNPTTGETLKRVANGVPGIGGMFHTGDIVWHATGPVDTAASSLVATGCAAGDVFVSQMDTGTVVARLQQHDGGVEAVAFSSSHVKPVLLATGGADGKIRVWDSESGVERCCFEHKGVTVRLVWHSALPLLASGSSDGTVALWDGLRGKMHAIFRGPTSFVTDVCFAGGQEFIAATSADGAVRIFDIRPFLSQSS